MDEQLEFIKQIAQRLQSMDLNYMMTGSMAMAVYATPRMTRDVDVVLECSPADVDTIVALFAPDCYIDRDTVATAVAERGMFNIIHNEWIIKGDFIVRKDDPYRLTEFSRRRQVNIEGVSVSVVAPEDLVLSKLVWARDSESELQRKDVRVVLDAGGELNQAYLNQWADHLGVSGLLEGTRWVKNLSSDIEQRVRTMMASLTPEARLRMASRMFATGRSLALAGRTTFGTDRRVFLFDRLYSSDFSERERARILSRMETRAELTARETSQLD